MLRFLRNRFSRALTIISGLGGSIIFPLIAQAQTVRDEVNKGLTPLREAYGGSETAGLRQYIFQIINILLSVLGVILICYIIYGGYIWMMAQGNEEEVNRAKGIIRTAIIGVLIIFMAYALANFVLIRLSCALTRNSVFDSQCIW